MVSISKHPILALAPKEPASSHCGLKSGQLGDPFGETFIARESEILAWVSRGFSDGDVARKVPPEALRFGPFELSRSERVLRRDGVTLPLGSRAFDILVYLAERPGEVIRKKELIDHVWSDVTVEEGNLKVHVAAIRKALEDSQFGNRYIASVKGRGYSFIESVVRLEDSTEQRRFAAILAADVVGYSALLQRAEEATYAEFERIKTELISPSLSRHEGRLIKTTGNGALAEFASPLAAMRCAVEIQDHLASGGSTLRLRVGLNLGDVTVGQDGDLYGDGITIAVRLEGRSGLHPDFREGVQRSRRQVGRRLRGSRRAATQEHLQAGPCVRGMRWSA
jgi:DNA-binding winged helix-turn-helix (wHTH) protein